MDNVPVDEIVKLFRMHQIFISDDVEVISFAPSEYLRNQFLLRYLWNLKLSVWPMICNMLHNAKHMRHVSNQLIKGTVSYELHLCTC